MNIYVSNLSFAVQDEDLREFFTEYGEVTSAKVITDKVSSFVSLAVGQCTFFNSETESLKNLLSFLNIIYYLLKCYS
mgnify:CR=1 FL=1